MPAKFGLMEENLSNVLMYYISEMTSVTNEGETPIYTKKR